MYVCIYLLNSCHIMQSNIMCAWMPPRCGHDHPRPRYCGLRCDQQIQSSELELASQHDRCHHQSDLSHHLQKRYRAEMDASSLLC